MADIYKIGYQKQARDGYKAKREANEKKLGDTHSFHERVTTVEGSTTPEQPQKPGIGPVRACQGIPEGYQFPVASVRSEKAPATDVTGKIRDHRALKGSKRTGGRRK